MFASKKAAALTMALAAAAVILLMIRMAPLNEALESYQGDNIVSIELALTPTRAESVIRGWTAQPQDCSANPAETGACAVNPEAWKTIHWDWAFIAAYLVLMLSISALVLLSQDDQPSETGRGRLKNWATNLVILLPAAVAVADALENLFIYALLGKFEPLGTGFIFGTATVGVGILAAVKFLLLFAYAVALFKAMQINLQVLALVRFSLLMLAVGIIAIFVPQWQEVLLAVAEDDGWRLSIWLFGATLIAAITTWYSARVIYMLNLGSSTPAAVGAHVSDAVQERMQRLREASDPGVAKGLKERLPRLLGFLIPPIVAVGLGTALSWAPGRLAGGWKPFAALALSLVLYAAFVKYRRSLAKWLYELLNRSVADESKKGFAFLNMNAAADDDFGQYDGLLKLPLSTRVLLTILFALNVLVFLSVWDDALWVQSAGGAAVVLGAIGLMVPVGTWFVYWGERLGLPILLLLFGLAALFSLYNDNHWVRLSADASSTDGAQQGASPNVERGLGMDLRAYTEEWARKKAEQSAPTASSDDPIPLFLVSAEGGGIRAAYWTAWVLGSLQDLDPRFADHLFAISGVSGGSLGAAVFSAQMAGGLDGKTNRYSDHADQVLRKDFLAPTLATLLFPDLFQRFLPWPVFNDRAMTLEKSWEKAWETAWPAEGVSAGTDDVDEMFARRFTDLWSGQSDNALARRVPLLFFNSTVVETGNRLIMHPLHFDPSAGTFAGLFKDAVDGHQSLGSEVPLSTAVHLSARFTYVSPAGSIQNRTDTPESDRNRRWVRLVDGGYFENSGAVTSREILTALESYKNEPGSDGLLTRLRPFVIHISNEPLPFRMNPEACGAESEGCDRDLNAKHRGKQAALGEVLSPLWALLNVRPARGYQAREALFRQMDRQNGEASGSNHVHFTLRDLDTSLPLGWVLSQQARIDIQKQLPPVGDLAADIAACKDPRNPPCIGNCSELALKKIRTVCDNLGRVEAVMVHLRAKPKQ